MKTLIKMTIGVILLVSPGTTFAAQADIGKLEYEANCAVCHGLTAKGDGPLAAFLTQPMPPLTGLKKENEGVFPFERVYMTIDGREEVLSHGPREMPIWGDEYNAEVLERHGQYYGGLFVEEMIHGRILALIAYISRLQEK